MDYVIFITNQSKICHPLLNVTIYSQMLQSLVITYVYKVVIYNLLSVIYIIVQSKLNKLNAVIFYHNLIMTQLNIDIVNKALERVESFVGSINALHNLRVMIPQSRMISNLYVTIQNHLNYININRLQIKMMY